MPALSLEDETMLNYASSTEYEVNKYLLCMQNFSLVRLCDTAFSVVSTSIYMHRACLVAQVSVMEVIFGVLLSINRKTIKFRVNVKHPTKSRSWQLFNHSFIFPCPTI